MAKIYLDRLVKKLGLREDEIAGGNYRKVMTEVLANNTENASKAVGRLSSGHWDKSLSRLGKRKKNFIVPNVEEVLPKRSVFINKAAIQGDLISDTLRDKLTKNLRDALNEFRTKSGEPAFIRRRGTKAGTINPKLVQDFQKRIIETFSGYTSGDIPNVKTIAVTEIGSAVNGMKEAYNDEFLRRNPQAKMIKRWIQNKSLSKIPRDTHSKMHGKEIPYNEKFQVPLEIKGKIVGVTPMSRPHDPAAPIEQIAGCHCDILYFAEIDGES